MRPYFNTPLGISMPLGVPKNIAPLAAAGLGALFSVGASAAGSGISNWINAGSSAEAFRRQKELQENQQDFQKSFYNQMFEKESNYNSPSEQMKRYEAAGLNPYLLSRDQSMIGSGATAPSAPSVPSVPSVAPTAPVSMDFTSGMSAIPQLLASQSQIKRNDAETFSKIVESLPELGKTLGWETTREVAFNMLGILGSSNPQYEQLLDNQIKQIQLNNDYQEIQNEIASIFAFDDAKLINANLRSQGQKLLTECQKMLSDIDVNSANINEIEERIKTYASQIIKNFAEAHHLRMSADQIEQLTPLLVRQATSQAESDWMATQEDWSDFNQGELRRRWQNSDAGKMEGLATGVTDDNSAANLINKIVRGKQVNKRVRRR